MSRCTILNKKGTWLEVLNDCRFTVNKEPLIDKEPSEKFKKKIIIAEHSPIRDISYKWKWTDIPHWETVHWVRHKWEKFVATARSDRTGIDRHTLSQDAVQNMIGEANIQHLIDTMRKRLCMQASKETREDAIKLKKEISSDDKIIGNAFVPNCIYRCGCPEQSKCKFFEEFRITFPYATKDIFNIQDRYDVYNERINNNER